MGRVEGEEELEVGATGGVEERGDGGYSPAIVATHVQGEGIYAEGKASLDIGCSVCISDAANLLDFSAPSSEIQRYRDMIYHVVRKHRFGCENSIVP